MIDDDNFCFSFIWKPATKPEIKFWMEQDGNIFHGFFLQGGDTFHSEGADSAQLLADAITAAGLGEREAGIIFDGLMTAMRKSFH